MLARLAVSTLLAFALTLSARADGPEWKLVWADEFDRGDLDKKKWGFDLTNGFVGGDGKTFIGGWGNGELQYYTDRPENVFVKDGHLHVRAVKEKLKNCNYTSARIKTQTNDKKPLFNQLYGRFEIRAKLPLGKGVWPAIWMLPQANTYGGWAASGEIDIMEARGQEPNKVLGTLHYGSGWPANVHTGKDYLLPENGTIAAFHTYALEWEPGEMRWYVDDKLYQTQNFWWSSSKRKAGNGVAPANDTELNPWPAPFDQPFYLILNVAVGGQFLGNPDAKTEFPVEMLVDYVRVYEKVGGYGTTKERGKGKLPFAK